jgi:dihydrodipicolinate synthase/N-acetylneuraminate lyase
MDRAELVRILFPQEVPALWCPLITHYREGGEIDETRTSAHIRTLTPYVGGFLAPGSTGEGWEMDNTEIRELLSLLLTTVDEVKSRLLIGVLKTGRKEATGAAEEILGALKLPRDIHTQYLHNFFGITATPPKGENLSQEEIAEDLGDLLGLGYPTALYQLPQITGNEIHPQTARALAEQYPNFYLFKDTSGKDSVARSGEMPEDLRLLRGAEGEYAAQLRSSGGPYFGFLLSTANCFAPQLARIISLSEEGRHEESQALSARLSDIVDAAFQEVAGLPFGNPFANANKGIDHFMAYGAEAYRAEPPLSHSGERLPRSIIERLGALLEAEDLLPPRGYLQG